MAGLSTPAASSRRKHPRFPVREVVAESVLGSADVLNLSRGGMAMATRKEVEVGRICRFEVRDRLHSIEVDAEVRWSRLVATHELSSGQSIPQFSTGVAFLRVYTQRPQGIWAGLKIGAAPPPPPAVISRTGPGGSRLTWPPVALISISSPENGAVVPTPMITVKGTLRVPMQGLIVEVNGVEARLTDESFEAEIVLSPGPNSVVVAVGTETAFLYRSPAVSVTFEPEGL